MKNRLNKTSNQSSLVFDEPREGNQLKTLLSCSFAFLLWFVLTVSGDLRARHVQEAFSDTFSWREENTKHPEIHQSIWERNVDQIERTLTDRDYEMCFFSISPPVLRRMIRERECWRIVWWIRILEHRRMASGSSEESSIVRHRLEAVLSVDTDASVSALLSVQRNVKEYRSPWMFMKIVDADSIFSCRSSVSRSWVSLQRCSFSKWRRNVFSLRADPSSLCLDGKWATRAGIWWYSFSLYLDRKSRGLWINSIAQVNDNSPFELSSPTMVVDDDRSLTVVFLLNFIRVDVGLFIFFFSFFVFHHSLGKHVSMLQTSQRMLSIHWLKWGEVVMVN